MRLLRLPGVFRPISDSWMLASLLRRERIDANTSVLDLCTGSGLLAVVAGLAGAGEVTAVDVSRRALLAARLNGMLNRVRIETRRGDLFGAVAGRRFDVIVSNPPYVPGTDAPTRGLRRAWEAGPRGRDFLDRICAEAPRHLAPGGLLLMCHSTICGESETLDALRSQGLAAEVVFRHVGTLGPRLRERREWLERTGLLTGEQDEIILVRAQAEPAAAAGREGRSTSRRASRCSPPGAEPPPAWRACAGPAATEAPTG